MASEHQAVASAADATDVVLFDAPVFSEDTARIAAAQLPWEKYRNTEILVTGASGMIPMYIVGALLAANEAHDLGLHVTGMVRNRTKAEKRFGTAVERSDFTLLDGDVIDTQSFGRKFSTVFHGASPARPSLHKSSPVTTLKANTLGTINLLDALVESGGESFVLLSSSEVYGAVNGSGLIREDDEGTLQHFAPRASYSEGKRIAETALAAYADEFSIRCLSLRFGHIYGPGMALDDGRVQADFLADIVRGRNVRMMSAGAATRTYTYVADAVEGLFYAHLNGRSRSTTSPILLGTSASENWQRPSPLHDQRRTSRWISSTLRTGGRFHQSRLSAWTLQSSPGLVGTQEHRLLTAFPGLFRALKTAQSSSERKTRYLLHSPAGTTCHNLVNGVDRCFDEET